MHQYFYQVLRQSLHQNRPRKHHHHKQRKPMETMHHKPSEPSQNPNHSHPNICMHHHFQHHISPTPNILRPTRQFHEHKTHQILPHSPSLPPIHPLHHPHLPSPNLRHVFRPICTKNHQTRLRYHPFNPYRDRPIRRNILNGCSCPNGA